MDVQHSGRSIRNDVIAGVIAGIILLIVAGLVGFIPGAWAWLISAIESVWSHCWKPSWVPNLFVYVMMVITAFFLVLLSSRLIRRPEWEDYQQDTFVNVVWRWRYLKGQIIQPVPYCPKCDMSLVHYDNLYDSTTTVWCERCKHQWHTASGRYAHVLGMVVREIDRKIRNREWKRQ